MGSGSNSPSGLDSFSSLEIALDRAIAQRSASVQEWPNRKRRNSPAPMTAALTVTSKDTALAVIPARLSWRGIAVTEEFQEYAARVARGEQLAPYRGEVLSLHCPEFPWGSPPATSTTVPTPTLSEYPGRGRSLKSLLVLVASVGSIVAAFGVGAGATSSNADERDPFGARQVSPTLAAAPSSALAARPSAELDTSVPDDSTPPASPTSTLGAPAVAPAELKTPRLTPTAVARRQPLRSPVVQAAPELRPGLGPNPSPAADVNRLTIPPALSPPYGTAATSTRVNPSLGVVLGASAPPASTALASSPDSTLFSDRPSF
jgi:hypothetical protein